MMLMHNVFFDSGIVTLYVNSNTTKLWRYNKYCMKNVRVSTCSVFKIKKKSEHWQYYLYGREHHFHQISNWCIWRQTINPAQALKLFPREDLDLAIELLVFLIPHLSELIRKKRKCQHGRQGFEFYNLSISKTTCKSKKMFQQKLIGWTGTSTTNEAKHPSLISHQSNLCTNLLR